MSKVLIKRGSRAQIDAAATGGQLAQGELYLITDENRPAIGTGASAYSDVAIAGDLPPYTNHGDVSGTVGINLDDGTHVLHFVGYTDLEISAGTPDPGKGARVLVTRDNLGTWDATTPAGWKWVGTRQTVDPGATEELELLLLPLSGGGILASIRSIL